MLDMLLDTTPMSHEIKTNDKPDRPWSFIAPKASADGACIEMQMSYCYGVLLVYGSYIKVPNLGASWSNFLAATVMMV